jgi:hypothetical protein
LGIGGWGGRFGGGNEKEGGVRDGRRSGSGRGRVQTLEELVIERVDKETEMKKMEEGSKGDEAEKKDGDHEMEEMEKE